MQMLSCKIYKLNITTQVRFMKNYYALILLIATTCTSIFGRNKMDNVYIVIPAYNEEETIVSVINQWYPIVEKIGNESKLVVIDDGSKDSTFHKMQTLKNQYPHLVTITKKNTGHGPTCLFGYKYSIKNNPSHVFQTDSDGQTVPNEFWQFWDLRNQHDIMIGSRKNRKDGFDRIIVTNVLKMFLYLMMGAWVEDSNSPFRLMKTKTLSKHLHLIPNDFFLSNVLLSTIFVIKNENIKWIPITFKQRQGGICSANILKIFKIGFRSIKDFWFAKSRLKQTSK